MSLHYKEVAKLPELPVDHLQGYAECGTPVYSNKDPLPNEVSKDFQRFAVDGWAGVAHQCVCFARRILWNRFGYILPDVQVANQIFYIPHLFEYAGNGKYINVPVKTFRNGGTTKPVKDSIIIYASHWSLFGESNFPGHVGFIADVDDDRVYVVDQNRYYHSFNGKTYSASFPLLHNKEKGTWTIEDHDEPVVGWITLPEDKKPDFSRYEESLEKSHKVYPRSDNSSKHKHPASRPMPQEVLDSFPSYDSSWRKWSWWKVMNDFRPHPVLFPFIFIFMLTKFLVYYPLKMKIMRIFGMMGDE